MVQFAGGCRAAPDVMGSCLTRSKPRYAPEVSSRLSRFGPESMAERKVSDEGPLRYIGMPSIAWPRLD